MKFLLGRSMRAQADLVDQLFNSSEKRLARILLLMAQFGEPGDPETLIPPISQDPDISMLLSLPVAARDRAGGPRRTAGYRSSWPDQSEAVATT